MALIHSLSRWARGASSASVAGNMQHMLHCCLSELLMSCFRVLAVPGLENRDDRNAVEKNKKRAYQLELERQVRTLSVQRYYAVLTTSVMDVMRSLQFVSPSLNRMTQKVAGRFQQNFLGRQPMEQ